MLLVGLPPNSVKNPTIALWGGDVYVSYVNDMIDKFSILFFFSTFERPQFSMFPDALAIFTV